MNRTPLWQSILLGALILLAALYALPSFYGEYPAVEVAFSRQTVPAQLVQQTARILQQQRVACNNISRRGQSIIVACSHAEAQLRARDVLSAYWGDRAQVALALRSRAPNWLTTLGAHPMKLGLDLRGGVHFLLDVDVNAVLSARMLGDVKSIKQDMRQAHLRYRSVAIGREGNVIELKVAKPADLVKARSLLAPKMPDYDISTTDAKTLTLKFPLPRHDQLVQRVITQNMTTLTNRVNELGLSEAVVQQQGKRNISVDLPGIQNIARAKSLIGKTATLRFQLVDEQHSLASALEGQIPLGSQIAYDQGNQPILLQESAILTGESITGATTGTDEYGRPNVNVFLGGGGEALFYHATAKNVGKRLAVVYVETKPERVMLKGRPVTRYRKHETVISVAVIQQALSNQFTITGQFTNEQTQQLAMLLRSGSFAAPVSIIQEQTVGPSLGKENIQKGILSIEVGSILVVVFMMLYYRLFGLVADIALLVNIIFIVAALSLLGATLTLAGMAGIVLTVGMAVDANVLIYERIREELRAGHGAQKAIQVGYERAFVTIVDSNVTTLIVALILFALGSASVKGFAVTLTIGLIASMITAICLTRIIINTIYGGKRVKKLSIGI